VQSWDDGSRLGVEFTGISTLVQIVFDSGWSGRIGSTQTAVLGKVAAEVALITRVGMERNLPQHHEKPIGTTWRVMGLCPEE